MPLGPIPRASRSACHAPSATTQRGKAVLDLSDIGIDTDSETEKKKNWHVSDAEILKSIYSIYSVLGVRSHLNLPAPNEIDIIHPICDVVKIQIFDFSPFSKVFFCRITHSHVSFSPFYLNL